MIARVLRCTLAAALVLGVLAVPAGAVTLSHELESKIDGSGTPAETLARCARFL